ncbi:MAG: MerR family transcriptional regulator [Clostridiales bacterium]|nr:MerR family transcriptional regulator [Clostridiales bacterium]
MKEYLTIKEFSSFTGIEQTTLRYWDEIGLFSPAKRDAENNYRYYSSHQIISAKFVTVLSDLNIPLKIIGELAKARTPESLVRLIERKEKLLDMELQRIRECYSIMHTRLELINYGIRVTHGFQTSKGVPLDYGVISDDIIDVDATKMYVLQREDKTYILGPPNGFKPGDNFMEGFTRFCLNAKDLHINLNFPVGGYHTDMGSFLKVPCLPDYFFSFDPTGNRVIPGGKYLIGFTRSYYGQADDLPERVAAYIEENSIKPTGPVYSLYLHDELCVKEPDQYLMQVCVAVE